MALERQRDLFGYALVALNPMPDLVNHCLEVFEDERGEITITLYEIPAVTPARQG